MLFTVISVFVIATAANVVHGTYQYRPKINGWVNIHRVSATWEDALRRCMEEGAILASPINEDLTVELQTLFENTSFFIGANARFNANIFMSVEGVLIDDMPLAGMYDSLNSNDGQCLSMNNHSVRAVPCETRLPYLCYKQRKSDVKLTKCGTFDKEYKFEESTGSCYKYHYDIKSWSNAFATCVAEGGYLTVLNNKQEADIVVKKLKDTSAYILTGLRNWIGTGSWMSIFGEPIEQLHNVWEDGAKPTDSSDMCAFVHPSTAMLKNYTCGNVSFYICEKEPTYIFLPVGEQ